MDAGCDDTRPVARHAVDMKVGPATITSRYGSVGAFLTYTGAIVSHLTTGYDLGEVRLLAVLTALTVLSWALRPPSRRTSTTRPVNATQET
jgi:hypothetical protein